MRKALAALGAGTQPRVGFHRTALGARSGADIIFTQGIAHAKDHRWAIPKANNAND
jgi:hypothetical protein